MGYSFLAVKSRKTVFLLVFSPGPHNFDVLQVLQCTVINEGEINYSMENFFFFDFMADFKNLGLFMMRNHIFDKNLKQYGRF